MPPSSETITGMAGATMVWLTAATSMPSISPTKITFLRGPLFAIFPSVLHQPGDDAERPPEFHQFLLVEFLPNTLLEPFAALLPTLDQAASPPGSAQPHHPAVLRIPLPARVGLPFPTSVLAA